MTRIGKERTMTVEVVEKLFAPMVKEQTGKKAIITLKDGENLDLMEMGVES